MRMSRLLAQKGDFIGHPSEDPVMIHMISIPACFGDLIVLRLIVLFTKSMGKNK